MEVSALLQILLMQVTTLCIAFTFLLINISAVYAKARTYTKQDMGSVLASFLSKNLL